MKTDVNITSELYALSRALRMTLDGLKLMGPFSINTPEQYCHVCAMTEVQTMQEQVEKAIHLHNISERQAAVGEHFRWVLSDLRRAGAVDTAAYDVVRKRFDTHKQAAETLYWRVKDILDKDIALDKASRHLQYFILRAQTQLMRSGYNCVANFPGQALGGYGPDMRDQERMNNLWRAWGRSRGWAFRPTYLQDPVTDKQMMLTVEAAIEDYMNPMRVPQKLSA